MRTQINYARRSAIAPDYVLGIMVGGGGGGIGFAEEPGFWPKFSHDCGNMENGGRRRVKKIPRNIVKL
jgi:hypothetical protein